MSCMMLIWSCESRETGMMEQWNNGKVKG
jgi:hypothetical protein